MIVTNRIEDKCQGYEENKKNHYLFECKKRRFNVSMKNSINNEALEYSMLSFTLCIVSYSRYLLDCRHQGFLIYLHFIEVSSI